MVFVIRNSGDLLESNQGFCPTIEMTFSMANVPGDFPNMNGDSKHPEVVTTKIVGFDSDDVVEGLTISMTDDHEKSGPTQFCSVETPAGKKEEGRTLGSVGYPLSR